MFRLRNFTRILSIPLASSLCHQQFALSNGINEPKSKQLLEEFSQFLDEEQIVTNVAERQARGKAWNSYHRCDTYPMMILYPQRCSAG